jgi:transcriptional regulator with XRE-family HTH domain
MGSRNTTGQILKKARLTKNLTQAELAQKAGIHPNTYAKLERDEQSPSFATIKKLAKILNVNLEDIPE